MGQGASQPEQSPTQQQAVPSRRRSVFRRLGADSADHSDQGVAPRPRTRRHSTNRLSQILHSSSGGLDSQQDEGNDAPRERPSALQRSRTTFRNVFSRREASLDGSSNRPGSSRALIGQRTSYIHRRTHLRDESSNYLLPDVDRSNLDLNFTSANASAEVDPPPRTSNSTSQRSRPSLRFNPLRSTDRSGPFRTLTSSLRRRRSSPRRRTSTWTERPNAMEDQAAMLSRLLSVAAAATAATLMGDDHQAVSEARSLTEGTGMAVGDAPGPGEDGTFDGFLRALQNGRIASALRQGSGEGEGGEGAQQAGPLNFFRMFRFGASAQARRDGEQPQAQSQGVDGAGSAAPDSEEGANTTDGRMVPIIIVGIRSISPTSAGANASTEDLPPFIDALGSFPSPLPASTLGGAHQDSIDSILRPPQNGTSFRHRRRASMGGFGMGRSRISERLDDRLDNQRDHRSPDRRRQRPWSMASSSMTSPLSDMQGPPVTPATASPELSRISSRNSTPSHSRPTSLVANSMRELAGLDSRRNSMLHRSSAASPLSSHTEETVSLHSTHSSTNLLSAGHESRQRNSHRRSDTAPNIHYPRFASGHPRRNGVVEPDNLPSLSRTSTSNATDTSNTNGERRGSGNDSRSWIIYVLGGSYPENHPILTTPSLFTENPTYEDMMLLSALLGPAKAPVASEEDVEQAGGVYTIAIDATETAQQVEEETATRTEGENTTNGGKDASLKPPYVNPAADAANTARLVALATTEGVKERVSLELGQRCLVCLCDFEEKEIARRLVKCEHLFHKECIDQWLTQGRNSCPLCRGEGVDEKSKAAADVPAEANVEDGTRSTRSRSRASSSGSASTYLDYSASFPRGHRLADPVELEAGDS